MEHVVQFSSVDNVARERRKLEIEHNLDNFKRLKISLKIGQQVNSIELQFSVI